MLLFAIAAALVAGALAEDQLAGNCTCVGGQPVCGDGVDYGSDCLAKCANAAHIVSGACPTSMHMLDRSTSCLTHVLIATGTTTTGKSIVVVLLLLLITMKLTLTLSPTRFPQPHVSEP